MNQNVLINIDVVLYFPTLSRKLLTDVLTNVLTDSDTDTDTGTDTDTEQTGHRKNKKTK